MSLKKIIRKKIHQKLDWLYGYIKARAYKESESKISGIITEIKSVGYGFKYNGTNLYISKPKKVIIGNNVHIGENFYAKTDGGLIIGHNTHISRNVTLYTENYNYEGVALPYDHTSNYKPVIIGDNVWIGMNVSIVPGVTIGEGAIIGLGTVVNRDVKPYEVVGPALAQTIKQRDVDHYKLLNLKKAYGGVSGKPLIKKEIDCFVKTYEEEKDKPLIFVLGTGRSGTVSITDLFNQHHNCFALHEHFHQITRISTQFAYTKDNNYQKELESLFSAKIWDAKEDQLLVHSDQRFWNLVPFLSSYFPNAKFIHLVREPFACIKSMYERGWYSKDEYPNLETHDWAKFRLNGYMVGEFSHEDWNNLDALEKCVWYYFYVNNTIKKSLEQLPKLKSMRINLELLNESTTSLFGFCEVEQLLLKIDKKNINKKNAANVNDKDKSQLMSLIEKYDNIYQ